MKSPNAAGPHVDLAGTTPRPPEYSEGTTRFAFANRTHHEIVLNDARELHAMVDAARASMAERTLPVTRDEVLDYAAAQESAGNPEWVAVLRDDTKREWKNLVDKYRAAKARAQ